MAAYLVGNLKVTNAEGFGRYRELVGKTISDHGGEYVVADVDSKAIEGNPEHLSVVLKFDSMDALQGWYCLLYTSPSPRDGLLSRMPSSA